MAAFLVPLARVALGALGAGAMIHWAIREARRINAELDRVRNASDADAVPRSGYPTLRRDPQSGEWRVG
jgi:hypothetical protein